MRLRRQWLVPFIALAGVAWASAIYFDVAPWLRGPAGWRWALAPASAALPLLRSLLAALLFFGGWLALGGRLRQPSRRMRPTLALFLLVALALLLQYSLLGLRPTTQGQDGPVAVLFERLASDQASGYFTVAQEIEHLPTFLHDYPELMPEFRPDPHPRSKPPGIVLAYWLLERLFEQLPGAARLLGEWGRGVCCHSLWLVSRSDAALASNTALALLLPLLSALAIVPAYRLAGRHGGPGAGWLAAGLVAVMPGRLAFAPHMDTVYPLLTLLALDLLDAGVERDRAGRTLLGGVVIGAATFLSLVNGLVAVLAGLWLLLRLVRRGQGLRQWAFLRHGALLAAGVLLIWLAYWLVSGVTPLAIYHAAAPARHDLQRDYALWLGANVYDFALFAGPPALLLALPRRGEFRGGAMAALVAAFWLLFVVLDASGMIRGEVGRIWLMLAAAPAVLAARRAKAGATRLAPLLLAATLLLAWSVNVRWEVTQVEWPRQPAQPLARPESAPTNVVHAPFGPAVSLNGYDLALADMLDVTLYWEAVARPQTAYTVFIHLVGADGAIAAQEDVMPQQGARLTTCWRPGEVVADAHHLDTAALPAGDYAIWAGLYDQLTGVRAGEPLQLGQLLVAAGQMTLTPPGLARE